jgi:hypothetical protein
MNDENERSVGSDGSASLLGPRRLAHFQRQYDRMTYGPMERKMMSLRGKPKWRVALALPGVWVRQFVAGIRADLPSVRSARFATLFVRSVLVDGA